jgi:hypothetical protein
MLLPPTLDRLVGGRLTGLNDSVREALLVIAANGRLPAALAERLGIGRDALEPALRSGLIERSDGVLGFTHPLLASTVYQEARAADRAVAHRRLADVLDDPPLRARHLALAADGPDRETAATLEQAARVASDRGLALAAAELLEH